MLLLHYNYCAPCFALYFVFVETFAACVGGSLGAGLSCWCFPTVWCSLIANRSLSLSHPRPRPRQGVGHWSLYFPKMHVIVLPFGCACLFFVDVCTFRTLCFVFDFPLVSLIVDTIIFIWYVCSVFSQVFGFCLHLFLHFSAKALLYFI